MALKRFPNGAAGDFFFQKRAPDKRPDWLRTVELRFPSGRTADEIVVDDAAGARLGRQPRLHRPQPAPGPRRRPRPPRRAARRPRPGPGRRPGTTSGRWPSSSATRSPTSASSAGPRRPATAGSTSTSGSSVAGPSRRFAGPPWRWPATWSSASPTLATSKWWKEERHGVFIDYNQNAKDRTVASAYSVRPRPDARVSTPLHWDEVAGRRRGRLHRCAPCRSGSPATGDPHAGIDEAVGSLDGLLELSARHETRGPRRRPVAAQLREDARRAARASSRRSGG